MKNVFKIMRTLFAMMLIIAISSMVSCTGDVGPTGPAGADGAAGPAGPAGTDGTDGTVAIPTQADIDAYVLADGTIGARLYDNPANEILDQDANNATWADAALGGSSANFFRCKSCHGWDLLGQQGGSLIGKAPSATYPTAVAINLYQWARVNNIKTVFNAVKNAGGHAPTVAAQGDLMADYSSLGDNNIWALVKFLKETSHDVNDFYQETYTGTYPTGSVVRSDLGRGGDPVNGDAVYAAKCAGCHAADGSGIDIYCQGEWLGNMFRGDVHEIQHKAVWGMPTDRSHIAGGCAVPFGGGMPVQAITSQDIRDLIVAGQNATNYPDFN